MMKCIWFSRAFVAEKLLNFVALLLLFITAVKTKICAIRDIAINISAKRMKKAKKDYENS